MVVHYRQGPEAMTIDEGGADKVDALAMVGPRRSRLSGANATIEGGVCTFREFEVAGELISEGVPLVRQVGDFFLEGALFSRLK
jgi:hypothetical protein